MTDLVLAELAALLGPLGVLYHMAPTPARHVASAFRTMCGSARVVRTLSSPGYMVSCTRRSCPKTSTMRPVSSRPGMHSKCALIVTVVSLLGLVPWHSVAGPAPAMRRARVLKGLQRGATKGAANLARAEASLAEARVMYNEEA